MNDRARQLIQNLKTIKKVNYISLAKFTNMCLDLDLLEYLPAALKRLGQGKIIQLPKSMFKIHE